MTLVHGDCIEAMAGMDPESVDAIVTDPPYGLEFMGKEWDRLMHVHDDHALVSAGRTAPKFQTPTPRYRTDGMQQWHQRWAEAALRVAKPSAYLLAFGGTRTVHRMTCALEDAGWIIRDMLVWGYASGFPKSRASLKPAWEPIVMARKPGPLRMLAIDACRIPMSAQDAEVIDGMGGFGAAGAPRRTPSTTVDFGQGSETRGAGAAASPLGRWPANIVLTDPIFDGVIEGVVGGGETTPLPERAWTGAALDGAFAGVGGAGVAYHDSGSYSRFFILPKADRADREPVLGGPTKVRSILGQGIGGADNLGVARANVHPTVKPTDLMRHLVRLVTPTGGTVLDPFLGSGTTAIAAELEGFPWIGIEREAEYVAIAEARLNGTQRGLGLGA